MTTKDAGTIKIEKKIDGGVEPANVSLFEFENCEQMLQLL